jgi:hypothetical protein
MEKDVVLVFITMDNGIADILRVSDDYDPELKDLLDGVIEFALDDGEEIFEVGQCYLITEKGIYVACYSEEVPNLINLPKETDETNRRGRPL